MSLKIFIFLLAGYLSLFLISCGTSTGSRYSAAKETAKESANNPKKYPEDFDLTPYRAKITLKDTAQSKSSSNLTAWYGYHTQPDTGDVNRMVIRTAPGYRVQIISADNLDDANKMRSEIYFKTNQKAVYVIFDPPFYKVEVGDFTNISDARSLAFKFRQMGYNEARVVNQTVNIFQ